ncbi:MAG: hypothetical protein RLO80_00160 [Hyphomonas sp.]
MSETVSAPEPDTAALIGEARELSAGLVAFLFNQLNTAPASAFGPRMLRTLLRTVIKPCEALIRRAIYLLAARMPPLARPSVRPRTDPPPLPPKCSAPPTAPRVPAFRLTEPAIGASKGQLPRNRGPRISIFGDAPPAPVRSPVSPEVFNQRFVLRLAALRNAIADPDTCALRLRRRLAYKPLAARPLKPAAPPGIRTARTNRIKTLFADLEAATAQAWPRFADTS